MFDEMSIIENLHFSQQFGCIEGFEDLGSHSRTSNTANHARVFVLQGKRLKQPVAYYLINGSTKSEMLVNFLTEVLDACHNAALEVAATMCDMGTNNVKALKLKSVSEKTLSSGFRIKKLLLYLILPISLNVPTTFSSNIM